MGNHVMGTSHHEPMLRAQQEWKRYGKGKWDYDSNEAGTEKNFWRKGIKNMGNQGKHCYSGYAWGWRYADDAGYSHSFTWT